MTPDEVREFEIEEAAAYKAQLLDRALEASHDKAQADRIRVSIAMGRAPIVASFQRPTHFDRPTYRGEGFRHSHEGQHLTLSQWAELRNIHLGTLRTRIGRGWTISRALQEEAKFNKQPTPPRANVNFALPDLPAPVEGPIMEAITGPKLRAASSQLFRGRTQSLKS